MESRAKRIDAARGRALVAYVEGTRARAFPPEVINEAKRALVDILGTSIGAVNEEPVIPVRNVAEAWGAAGKARISSARARRPRSRHS